MSKYSKAEMQIMKSAFEHLFGCQKEFLDAPAITEWMENAPIGLVEYDGSLHKENRKGRDRRMEIIDVYDGNIQMLVEYLRRLYPEHKKLTKWELVFKIYDGIMTAQTPIEQAMSQVALSENGDTGEVPQETEELQNSQSSSTGDKVSETFPMNPPEPAVEEIAPTDSVPQMEVHEEPHAEVSDTTPSGNAHVVDEPSLSNKDIASNHKEEKNMSEIDAMLNAASKAAGSADPAQAQAMPGKANVTKAKGADSEAKARVADLLAGQKEQRNAWTRQNTVTAIISTMQPSALRALGNTGVAVSGETDATKALEEINKKINKFIVMVSGKEGITQDAFEAMSDAEKYANVVVKEGVDNVGKAAAMYALYKQIKQDPLAQIPAFIPTADKVSYPTRGYVIGSTPYPEQEFILQLIDNGMGVLYGEGSMDAQGNDVGEKPVIFKVGIASRQEKAVSTGVSTAKKTNKVPVVRPKNKKAFIAGGQHVQFLFTEVDNENSGTASFKAAINVGGELMGATVSVYSLKNGQKEQRGVKDDGTVTYKTKVASISVSVPVQKIKREFGAAFRTDGEDILVTAGRWGVQMKVDQAKGNFGNIAEFSSAPVIDVFANVYAGNVKLNDTLRNGSASIAMLQSAANEQAAADAAASSDELA